MLREQGFGLRRDAGERIFAAQGPLRAFCFRPQHGVRHLVFFAVVADDMGAFGVEAANNTRRGLPFKVKTHALMGVELAAQLFSGGLDVHRRRAVNLVQHGIPSQHAGDVISGLLGQASSKTNNLALALMVALGMLIFVMKSRDFRGSFDNILSGAVVGLAIVAGWYITGGPLGQSWKEYAEMATDIPSRVQVQSYTFVSPMGDTVRYLLDPMKMSLVNFGVVALGGVIIGSFLYAIATKNFRIEWFASVGDFVNHAIGGALMGVGGVLSMGCTVGQAITGMSTLAIGSMLTFVAIVVGAAATMKFQYWRMMREA